MGDAAARQGMLAVRADRAFDGREAIRGGALVLCADGQIVGSSLRRRRTKPRGGPGIGASPRRLAPDLRRP